MQVVSLTEPEALPALWQVDIERGVDRACFAGNAAGLAELGGKMAG
ncbi:MAG: hypothetical protein M5U34_49080 [Chloroflexi bacterium]|nr:hypothetical protein [Chloroflexota bacterium]